MLCSMSGKGDCRDNAPMECFFATVKGELVKQRDDLARDEARADVFQLCGGLAKPATPFGARLSHPGAEGSGVRSGSISRRTVSVNAGEAHTSPRWAN